MIDLNNVNMNEISGQLELSDLLPEIGGAEPEGRQPEGYDAQGRLMDYVPEGEGTGGPGNEATSSVSPSASHLPQGGRLLEKAEDEGRLEVLAAEINAITYQARTVLASAAVEIGRRLVEARGMVPEGRWLEWLEKNVHYGERDAQTMMQLYERFGRNGLGAAFEGLSKSQLVALLSAPEDEAEALAEKAKDEDLSVKALRQEIAKLRAEAARDQMKIGGLEERIAGQVEEIHRLDEREQKYDAAIVSEREKSAALEKAIADERQSVTIAEAKAKAAEETAQALRKEKDAAREAADVAASRASDAVQRANETQDKLRQAEEKIKALEEAAKPEVVEVVPDAIREELERLRAQANESAKARNDASAVERFKWFYKGQLQPAFAGALEMLKEVAREDEKAANAFATAIVTGCKRLMEQLGEGT